MGDSLPTTKLAAIQAAAPFLNRDAAVEKTCQLIREAGKNGAELVGFPESFIPGHPIWLHFHPSSGPASMQLSRKLFENSIEIPSPATDAIGDACREAGVIAVIGTCEKETGTTGTMYNTQLVVDRDGQIIGRHCKLVPTLGERIVHTGGRGETMTAFSTHLGTVGALNCGENANPLAAFVLSAQSTVIHVAAWPPIFGRSANMQEAINVSSRGLAHTLKAFVINAVGVLEDDTIEACAATDEDRAIMRAARDEGGSSIIGPRGQIVAGPMEGGEGILYADVDLGDVLIPKIAMDFGGHYNRFDIFNVSIKAGDKTIDLTAGGRDAKRVSAPLVTGSPSESLDPESEN